jgi:5'-nucleotidase
MKPPRTRPARRRLRTVLALALALLPLLAGRPGAAQVELCILGTTDIHASLTQGEEADRGGWLRLATLIAAQRAAAGPERTLLIDCGDTAQGTLAGSLSRGDVAMTLLDTLAYDVWVPGNHDFDFGVARLREFCRRQEARLLCGNVVLGREPGARLRPPAWRLIERGGARVAVIGATASYLSQWLWGTGMEDYEVEPAMEMLQRVLPDVHRAQPDLIVLAIHQGWIPKDPRGVNELPAIVARFPEIDLILGGHTHMPQPGTRLGARTWYVQAGRHGSHLARVQVTLDTSRQRAVQIRSELLEAGPEVKPDPLAQAAVQPWLDQADRFARRGVGRLGAAVAATGTPGRTCAISELICQALAAAARAEVVFHGMLSRAGLPAGTVREGHLFAVVPFENSIGVANLTPAEIVLILEEQWAQRESSAYNGLWGLQATIDGEGRVRDLRDRDGRPLAPGRRLRVAFNSYVVAGGGGRFPVLREVLRRPEAGLQDLGISTRDALRDQVRLRLAGRGVEARAWIRRQD